MNSNAPVYARYSCRIESRLHDVHSLWHMIYDPVHLSRRENKRRQIVIISLNAFKRFAGSLLLCSSELLSGLRYNIFGEFN